MKALIGLQAAALGLVIAATGCGRGTQEAAAPDAAPQRGGTLVVGLESEPDSFNIYLARTSASLTVAHRVLPRLAVETMPDERHEAGFTPLLAESWERSEDDRTLTFHLADGGRWSDGSQITCDDVAFTLRAQTDPALGWRAASIKRHIEALDCPDPLTAVFRFAKSYPEMLMDANDLHIVPASLASIPFETWREVEWAKTMPFSGPFKIEEHKPGQEIVLARHERFFARPELPWLDRVVLRVVPDQTARVTQLLSGDLDVVLRLAPDDAARVASSRNARVVRRPGAAYAYIGWNTVAPAAYGELQLELAARCERAGKDACPEDLEEVAGLSTSSPHPLFGDARVRKAMTLAIDRETIVDALLLGEGVVPASPMLAPLPEHDPELVPWPHDPQRARALLAEAGFGDSDGDGTLDRNGEPFSFELMVQAGNKLRRDSAVLVQQDLAAVGVSVEIVAVENSSFYPALARRDKDAWIGGWATSLRVDMTEMLHRDSCGSGGMNFGGFTDPRADELASAARELLDDGERIAAWREWERHFHDLQPYTVLFQENRLTGVSRRVRGVESILRNDDLAGVETWWIAAPGS
ncbi:MAG: ABC transporter substrate-binding protein [Acidobacteriota bacterium]|nr:ABC transporter substrate-binding protein [Acidobacteriota bacterium]